MQRIILCIALLAVISTAAAQPQAPDSLWMSMFGGNGLDYFFYGSQTADGGYIAVGHSSSFSDSADVYLVKTDSAGAEQWSHTYGGICKDIGNYVLQTSDGGYIITGYTLSYGAGNYDIYVIKTDSLGIEQWSNFYGGSEDDLGRRIIKTSDNGYIILGISRNTLYYDIDIVKIDSVGNEEWQQIYGPDNCDYYGYDFKQTDDSGFIICGWKGAGNYDVYLLKTDALGNLLWENVFGGFFPDYSYSVLQTNDGGFLITGQTFSYGNSGQIYLVKTDSTGSFIWDRNYGGIQSDYGACIQPANDNGFIIAGNTDSYGAGNFDLYLLKVDTLGFQVWDKSFGGVNLDICSWMEKTNDGDFIITGYTNSYGALGTDALLWKMGTDTSSYVNPFIFSGNLDNFNLYPPSPNPFNAETTISFNLPVKSEIVLTAYDISGRQAAAIASGEYPAGHHTAVFDGNSLPSGVYFLRLQTGNEVRVQKCVLLK